MNKTYNDRLFSNRGFRSWLHSARFLWLKKIFEKHNIQYTSVIELGCYDGKSISYLPLPPEIYVGYDANWEGGLDIFKQRWIDKAQYQAYPCSSIEEFNPKQQKFDLAICMETLEHLPRKELSVYLEKLANSCNQYAIITVPNEIGLLFFFKHLFKLSLHYLGKETSDIYKFSEFIYQILGISEKVEQRDHKGFNYKSVVIDLKNYFEIVEVKGTQFPFLPLFTNMNIGIVCKKHFKTK